MLRWVLAVGCVLLCAATGVRSARAAEDDGLAAMVREELSAWSKRHPEEFRVYWKGGPQLDAFGGQVKVGLHGRIMADFTFFRDGDEALEEALGDEFHSGFQFRRVWLTLNGEVTKYVGWMVQLAFDHGPQATFLDVWVRLQNLDQCFGCVFPDVKIGHYQEPIGLAWLTSSKHFQLTAWPLPTTTFTPGYNSGITLHSTAYGERVTAQVGFFGTDSGREGRHEWESGNAVTGRVTMLPWAPCEQPCRFLHLGAGASYRFDLEDTRFRSRPDLDFGPFVVDTGAFGAATETLLDLEAALVYDRFSIQGEWMWAHVDADEGTDPSYWGGYVQASYLLGAKCRKYTRAYGVFAGLEPCEPFDCTKGTWGAWELAARYCYVDLSDGDHDGGRCGDLVLGANWWWNPNARVMVNYVWSRVRDAFGGRVAPGGDGDVHAVVVRFQVHW